MKILKTAACLLAAAAFMAACDETTDKIGSTVTNRVDNINISQAIYNVTTESLVADSVLSTSNKGIIGKVRDPETGAYLTGEYMSQFAPVAGTESDTLEYIRNANNGKIEADSCFILMSRSSLYGDSLAPMKVRATELSTMVPEGYYYSNFDPYKEGYVKEGNYSVVSSYSLNNGYPNTFKIYLDKPYTDAAGKTYNNYGSYLLNVLAEHPEYFKSKISFVQHVSPGFYIEHEGGIGNVAEIWNTEIQFAYRKQKTIKAKDGVTDSIAKSWVSMRLDGTEEVLQINRIINDTEKLKQLAADESCTYLKSPAGIFTVATLPVEEIMKGHETDTLNTASIAFKCLNEKEDNDYNFSAPTTLMMMPLDSIHSFFEHHNITNNRTSYTATYSSGVDSYTFSNVSNLVRTMFQSKSNSANKYKVALIPVTVSTVTRDNSTVVSKVAHDMSLSSIRLQRGTALKPIEMKVIYSKFQEK